MFKSTKSKSPKYLDILLPIILIGVSLLAVFFYLKLNTNGFLNFSDGAKFAVIARNLVEGKGYGSDFTFYSPSLLTRASGGPFSASGVPILVPHTLSLFFKAFGISDMSVKLFSGSFYILLIIGVFLLGRKLYGSLTGSLSALAVLANVSILDYATSGASEPLYMFLTVISAYLIFLKKRWASLVFFLSLILIYLSKPQGVVFIASLLLAWFLMNFSWKKGLLLFVSMILIIFAVDKLVLYPLSFRYPVYPIVTRGIQAVFQYSPTAAVSDALRGQGPDVVSLSGVLKKTFYNLYNFYKLLPDILSAYLFGLFAIGLTIWSRNKAGKIFNILSILVVLGSMLLAALTIPFFRYLHPIIPFVYIGASATLVWIIEKIFSQKKTVVIISTLLILVLTIAQTLGVIFLDSRFEKSTHNTDKPPVYAKLSFLLRDNTDKNSVIVTNLDTWGSWYGERKTVWFPLEPKQLINPQTGSIPFDGIYLTSYLINDDNYRMGENWRMIFDNPNDSEKWTCDGCRQIAKEFQLKGVYKVSATENYERQDASAILLIKK